MAYEADEKELENLTAKLRKNLEIKDRKYLLKTYEKCFVGSEAVKYMLKNNICKTNEEGVWIGKALLAAGIIEHVTNDHDFVDGNKYYHFVHDKPSHGQKAKTHNDQDWSWNDFIPGKIKNFYSNDDEKDNKFNLQPKIEELNEEVETAIDALDLAPKESFGITPLDEYNKQLLDNAHPIKWENPKPDGKYNLVAIGAGTAGLVTAAGLIYHKYLITYIYTYTVYNIHFETVGFIYCQYIHSCRRIGSKGGDHRGTYVWW